MPPEPSNFLTINRTALEKLHQHAAAAARLVGHSDTLADGHADHVDVIAHVLAELLDEPRPVAPLSIHFSGHGGRSADIHLQDEQRQAFSTHRDVGTFADASIQLQGEQSQPQHVSARALTQMIASTAPSARLVVLNACCSDAVAEALRSVVDCVVGMRGAIGNAVAQAVATLAAKQLPDEHLPVCRTRDGISADQVILPSLDPPQT